MFRLCSFQWYLFLKLVGCNVPNGADLFEGPASLYTSGRLPKYLLQTTCVCCRLCMLTLRGCVLRFWKLLGNETLREGLVLVETPCSNRQHAYEKMVYTTAEAPKPKKHNKPADTVARHTPRRLAARQNLHELGYVRNQSERGPKP